MGRPALPSAGALTDGCDGSAQSVTAATKRAQAALAVARRDGFTTANDEGWLVATPAGREADTATQEAGAAVAARIEALAAEDLASVGQRPEFLDEQGGGFASSEEWTQHVVSQRKMLHSRALELKFQIEHLGRTFTDTPGNRDVFVATRAQFDQAKDAANGYYREEGMIAQGDGKWDRAVADVYSRHTLAVMAEQRDFGPRGGTMIATHPASSPTAVKKLRDVLAYYPTDWIDAEDGYQAKWEVNGTPYEKKLPLYVASATGKNARGHYSIATSVPLKTSEKVVVRTALEEGKPVPRGATVVGEGWAGKRPDGSYFDREEPSQMVKDIYPDTAMRVRWVEKEAASNVKKPTVVSELSISSHDRGCLPPGHSTAIHEYGHRVERMHPTINDLMQTHLAARTTNDEGKRDELQPFQVLSSEVKKGPPATAQAHMDRNKGSGKTEWTRPDDLTESYMGKQYDTDSSEMFSTGMEGVFGGQYGGMRGQGRWNADSAHRNLVLGALVAVERKS